VEDDVAVLAEPAQEVEARLRDRDRLAGEQRIGRSREPGTLDDRRQRRHAREPDEQLQEDAAHRRASASYGLLS
jgi:hypothetical protein